MTHISSTVLNADNLSSVLNATTGILGIGEKCLHGPKAFSKAEHSNIRFATKGPTPAWGYQRQQTHSKTSK